MQPINPRNVWLYAKKQVLSLKSNNLTPNTLRLLAFLVFNKVYGTNMLIKFPIQKGWSNQYTAFSSFGQSSNYYNFSLYIRYPYRSRIHRMTSISNAQNFFFDVFYDYQNQELILHDPENHNQAIEFNSQEYIRKYYQRLIDDFKNLDSIEKSITLENKTFLTKRIDENIRVGIDTNLFEAGCIETPYQYQNDNILCINGLFIQFDKDEEFFEEIGGMK
jgi:hypothetical protein